MSIPKEKRTREQMMRLLDRALEQEEILLEKVKDLEMELANCRQKAENPRHEFEQQALPKSKISFRLDYYRTTETGPLKGIIEHLPSRQTRILEAEEPEELDAFIARFVGATNDLNRADAELSTQKTGKSNTRAKKAKPAIAVDNEAGETPAIELPDSPEDLNGHLSSKEAPDENLFFILTNGLTHQRALRKGQAFDIGIETVKMSDLNFNSCRLNILVKSLNNRLEQDCEIVEFLTPNAQFLRIPVPALQLEQGVYKLIISLTLRENPQNSRYAETRLLIVQP